MTSKISPESSNSPKSPAAGHGSSTGNHVLQTIAYKLEGLLRPTHQLQKKYQLFRQLLDNDGEALAVLTQLESHLHGHQPADPWRLRLLCRHLSQTVGRMVKLLVAMNPPAYHTLPSIFAVTIERMHTLLPADMTTSSPPYILDLADAADHPELAGGKATNLSHAARAGVDVPDGFVITSSSFHRFLADNSLQEPFSSCLEQVHTGDRETIIRIASELQELIVGSEIAPDLAEQIEQKVANCCDISLLAVRSSALAEDGRISFAGQYASELQVPASDVIGAYRRVLAGKYCPGAIGYRIRHGLSDSETAMAVLVLPMYQPTYSGVIYSRDPAHPEEDILSIYVVEGLGQGLVDGSRNPVCYHLNRSETSPPPVPSDGLLTPAQLQTLREWALRLEHYFASPQDVEWLLADGRLLVVQSRPLAKNLDKEKASQPELELPANAVILHKGLHCAAPGIRGGRVFIAPNGKAFRDIPPNAIVVTPTLRPALSQFLDRVAGVVAASGSRASHFASVARERGIPVLVGENIELSQNISVTIDGFHGLIIQGLLPEQTLPRKSHHDFPREKFAEMAAAVCHLNLIDSESPDFRPEKCRSLHDFIRYCHERGVREMFDLVDRKGRGMARARRLQTDLPLVMYLLDLDRPQEKSKQVLTSDEIRSLPMRACWAGLCDPRITWDASQQHVDWQEFDQLSGGIFSLNSRVLASYAVTSSDYLHLNIRFGYHFSIVDALCGDQAGANYLNFRFKGGGAAAIQQGFRLKFIETVLNSFGFDTHIRGDMLDASLARESAIGTVRGLTRLGRLLAYTRMMDMRMRSQTEAAAEARDFLTWAA